jgi:hypothetical protein
VSASTVGAADGSRSTAGRMTALAIVVRVRPLEETRTPNSGCVWLAECEVGGRRFEAGSRHGAANALARELVAAGIADRPLEVYRDGVPGCMRWASLAAAARRTYTEGNRTLQCIRWIAPQDAAQAIRAPPKQGVERPAARLVPPEPERRAA